MNYCDVCEEPITEGQQSCWGHEPECNAGTDEWQGCYCALHYHTDVCCPDCNEFRRGQQIAYVPLHVNGDITHEDVQNGFVTSVSGDTIFCRYWSKYAAYTLRTKANSEGAHRSLIVPLDSHSQWRVDEELAHIDKEAAY